MLERDWLKSSLAENKQTKKPLHNTKKNPAYNRSQWKCWLWANNMSHSKEGQEPGEENAQGILLIQTNTWREDVQKVVTDPFQQIQQQNKRQCAQIEISKVSLQCEKEILHWGWLDAGTGSPESYYIKNLVLQHPMQSALASPALKQGAGLEDIQRCPPAPTSLLSVLCSCKLELRSTHSYWHGSTG